MKAVIIQIMYYKGAPKSVPNVHRIPMNVISKVGLFRGVISMIICRTHVLHMRLQEYSV